MCKNFHTRGVRNISHKSWLGAVGGEQKQDQQGGEAERLERKADELAVVRPSGELGAEIWQGVLRHVPVEQQGEMRGGDQEGQHAEMAAVIQQRQEAAIEP